MNRILIALSASFALGGCLLSPGTFSSELHLYSDERFSFAYENSRFCNSGQALCAE